MKTLASVLVFAVAGACLSACVPHLQEDDVPPPEPESIFVSQAGPRYLGFELVLLDDSILNVTAEMSGVTTRSLLDNYALCIAANYAISQGNLFARHVRTTLTEEAGLWRADAVYTISPELPPGLQTLEAEVVAADCAEQGIPAT